MADPCWVLALHLRGAAILLARVLLDKIDVQVMIRVELGARLNYVIPTEKRIKIFLGEMFVTDGCQLSFR